MTFWHNSPLAQRSSARCGRTHSLATVSPSSCEPCWPCGARATKKRADGIVTIDYDICIGGIASILGVSRLVAVFIFLGILLAYGFVGPLAVAIEGQAHADGKAFEAVKMGLIASLHGYNPNIAVEFARKTLNSDMRPTFSQLETHLKGQK